MRDTALRGATWLDRLARVLAFSFAVLAADTASAQQVPTLQPPRSGTDLAVEIRNAAADQLYAVELGLGRAVSVGQIRAVSAELKIPRVLAYVEFAHSGGQGRGLTILGLGEMYATTAAKEHSEC